MAEIDAVVACHMRRRDVAVCSRWSCQTSRPTLVLETLLELPSVTDVPGNVALGIVRDRAGPLPLVPRQPT